MSFLHPPSPPEPGKPTADRTHVVHLLSGLDPLFRLTLAVRGPAPTRVIVFHVFFSEEGGRHLVLDILGGNTVLRLGWSVFAGSADLPVS